MYKLCLWNVRGSCTWGAGTINEDDEVGVEEEGQVEGREEEVEEDEDGGEEDDEDDEERVKSVAGVTAGG